MVMDLGNGIDNKSLLAENSYQLIVSDTFDFRSKEQDSYLIIGSGYTITFSKIRKPRISR